MKDKVYRIFILLSVNASSCIVMAIQMDRTNCSVLSQLPLKGSGSDALVFLVGWPLANVCMLVRMVQATADAAWEAMLATSSGASITQVCKSLLVAWSCATSCNWLWKSSCRNGSFGPRESQYSSGSWWDMADSW